MEIIIIAGVAKNGVIGNEGKLPWHIKGDLKHFKEMTLNNAVIMGRTTYESIVKRLGKPLPDRLNIVLSKQNLQLNDGAIVANSIEDALNLAKGFEKVYFIGGQKVYEEVLKKGIANRLELTYIDKDFEGDAFFPELNFSEWVENKSEAKTEEGVSYYFKSYTKKKGLFISFEGIDGCGKTTQIMKFLSFLYGLDKYNHVLLTREPYQDVGIRKILFDGDPLAKAEQLANLFIGDRKKHASELIEPSLIKGINVVTDRYKLSTIAYQSAQGLPIEDLIERHKSLPVPDMCFFVDVPVEVAAERMNTDSGRKKHKLESDLSFMKRAREQFHLAAEMLKENIFFIDGTKSIDEIHEEIKSVYKRAIASFEHNNLYKLKSGESGVIEVIKQSDPEVHSALAQEVIRQEETLNMIPSENSASYAVRAACSSVIMNKYSEGYPGKRYYQGQQNSDAVENLAIERAKKLFGVEHANVQPYSGSPANQAVYLALCTPYDVVMGLALPDGGHLTHGWKVNFSGIQYKSLQYHVNKEGFLDFDEIRKLALENKPKVIWCGATAYSREFPFEEFAKIADEVNAYLIADISHIAGLVAAGVHKSPSQYAHVITTTTHKTLRGPRGAMIMITKKGLDKDPDLAKKIDKAVFPGLQGGPHENIIAAKAIAFKEAMTPEFKEYAKQIVLNSKALAESLIEHGIKLISGGSDNHLILADLTSFGIGLGKETAIALEEAGIVCNANSIPADPSTPMKPSGLRFGTPMITSRGLKEEHMRLIGNWISQVVKDRSNAALKYDIKRQIKELCAKYPANL